MFTRLYNRADMNRHLYELSKELKKEFGRSARFEIVIVGGAAIVLKHDFRSSSSDIDAIISNGASIKDAIRRTADRLGLAGDWLNSDFKMSSSYSDKLLMVSRFYKCFNQILDVRIVDDIYLIAMKLKSYRQYKNDQSDIIGLLGDNNFCYQEIVDAVESLYGKNNGVKKEAWEFLRRYFDSEQKDIYETIRNEELNNRNILVNFDVEYENVLKEDNLDNILAILRKKMKEDEELKDER